MGTTKRPVAYAASEDNSRESRISGIKVRTFFAPTYRVARAYGNITFADYTTQVFFDELFQWDI